MAAKKMKEPRNVVSRNIALTGEVMRYLLNHPKTFESLPDSFELVILPDDDAEMRSYNLGLLDRFGSEGKPIVFARLKSSRKVRLQEAPPSIYVPLAA
jgi:hypothetical protein